MLNGALRIARRPSRAVQFGASYIAAAGTSRRGGPVIPIIRAVGGSVGAICRVSGAADTSENSTRSVHERRYPAAVGGDQTTTRSAWSTWSWRNSRLVWRRASSRSAERHHLRSVRLSSERRYRLETPTSFPAGIRQTLRQDRTAVRVQHHRQRTSSASSPGSSSRVGEAGSARNTELSGPDQNVTPVDCSRAAAY